MADQAFKDFVTGLAAASTLAGTELIPVIQGGVTKSVAAAAIGIIGSGGGGTVIHEFDSGDTAPTWSPSTPATVNVNSTLLSHLYIETSDTTERLGTYAWTPGAGAFDVRAKISVGSAAASSGNMALGIHIGDSGNTNRLLLHITGQNGSTPPSISANTYTASTYTARGVAQANRSSVEYLRISRDGSNNCSFWWSSNGLVWNLIATQAFTLTVAKVGFRVQGGGAVVGQPGAVDFLRTNV